jgi:hypothetical protein
MSAPGVTGSQGVAPGGRTTDPSRLASDRAVSWRIWSCTPRGGPPRRAR